MPTTLDVAAVRALARSSRVLERASSELPLAHYRVLAAVASGDERASRVAARLALGKPAVSSAVDALCQRDLLARGPVDHDQRAAALTITSSGREVLERVETAMVERVRLLCERTPDPARVLEALTMLGDAMDELATERATERPA